MQAVTHISLGTARPIETLVDESNAGVDAAAINQLNTRELRLCCCLRRRRADAASLAAVLTPVCITACLTAVPHRATTTAAAQALGSQMS